MQLTIPGATWLETWSGLLARGAGRREAACVWAGRRSAGLVEVQDVVFLDDLPGVMAGELHHRVPRQASAALFELLRRRGLQIAADVHTHPDRWVDLSPVDRVHPIEFRVGLLAFILPRYAVGDPELARVGVHQYLGARAWRRWGPAEVAARILFTEGPGPCPSRASTSSSASS